jgi:rhamnosyltransferase
LLEALARQSHRPDRFLVMDSSSTDRTASVFRDAGATVQVIARSDFNHGGTRQRAVDALADVDIIFFLTQDAVPADAESFSRLLACFDDPGVGAAYGRQVPHRDADPLAAHARFFNYPDQSVLKSWEDRAKLGIKSVFISNSFAAYRRADLVAVGGFPDDLIMGEDTCVAARMLQAGRRVAYCAQAIVFHSHNYRWSEEFRRYFDTGVLHAREPWIREQFGEAGGEGWRFLRSELRYVASHSPWLLPSVMVRTALKFAGFKLGLQERRIPVMLKRRLSMFRPYWNP